MLELKEITVDEFEKLRRDFDHNGTTNGMIYNMDNDNLIAFCYVLEGLIKYYKIIEE